MNVGTGESFLKFNAGSKNKCEWLMKNMIPTNIGLINVMLIGIVTVM